MEKNKRTISIILACVFAVFFISFFVYYGISEKEDAESKWVSIAAGDSHAIALKDNNKLYSWGYNQSGQLGIGNQRDKDTPVFVKKVDDIKSIYAGDYFSMYLTKEGDLYGTGENRSGELGLNDYDNRDEFTKISHSVKYSTISAGDAHVLAIDTNGNLYSWGDNKNGQLGVGLSIAKSSQPMPLLPNVKFSSVSAGQQFSVAIDVDGNIWAWGINENGEIGNGEMGGGDYVNITRQTTPVKVSENIKFIGADAGKTHVIAYDEEGNLWGWGNNFDGQLGVEGISYYSVPAIISSEYKVAKVSVGDYHSMFVDENGVLYVFGYNAHGELGMNSVAQNYRKITKFVEDISFESISAGTDFTLYLTKDKEIYSSGSGDYGKLGTDKKYDARNIVKVKTKN